MSYKCFIVGSNFVEELNVDLLLDIAGMKNGMLRLLILYIVREERGAVASIAQQ